jgi:hypothetical protein
LLHRLDAAAANGRVLGVLADVGFPMPTPLAFLAVGFGNNASGQNLICSKC